MSTDYASYTKAHAQPFDVNAESPAVEDWGLYNAAHADPQAVPIESIQASPAGHLQASVTTRTVDGGNDGDPATSAHASVEWQPEPAAASEEDALKLSTLAQYEAVAPGLARALIDADQSRDRERRRYRLARLAVTTLIAITAIACGQWALVNGADQQALYLSTAGLVSLITTVLQHE